MDSKILEYVLDTYNDINSSLGEMKQELKDICDKFYPHKVLEFRASYVDKELIKSIKNIAKTSRASSLEEQFTKGKVLVPSEICSQKLVFKSKMKPVIKATLKDLVVEMNGDVPKFKSVVLEVTHMYNKATEQYTIRSERTFRKMRENFFEFLITKPRFVNNLNSLEYVIG